LAGCSSQGEQAEVVSQENSTDEKRTVVSGQVVGSDEPKGRPYLTFLISPRNGMTRRLRDLASGKASSGECRLNAILEGPYGSSAKIRQFSNVLFIAGGSGITAVLPYIRAVFEDQKPEDALPNIKLVWAVRQEGFARDVLANDLDLATASSRATEKLSMDIFVTSGSTMSEVSSLGEASAQFAVDSRFNSGRPSIESLVDGFIDTSSGPTAVFVCGPGKMADDTRSAVIKCGRKTSKTVELFEEMYGW
jgi:NAD(P)H-flavin reductase